MAELNVQPKKKSSILPWILAALGVIALIWFLSTRNRNGTDTVATNADTTLVKDNTAVVNDNNWDDVNFNAPVANYDEISDANINVRGDNRYSIYGLGENILFDEGEATIRTDAEANLKQVAASIEKRYNSGQVRIYGYTDSVGSATSNKELAQQRADAVKLWLQNNGINEARISENAIGESQPVSTNSTEQGRQQNRRVEIVARGSNK